MVPDSVQDNKGALLWHSFLRIPSVRRDLDKRLGIDCLEAVEKGELSDQHLARFLLEPTLVADFFLPRCVPHDHVAQAKDAFQDGTWIGTYLPADRLQQILSRLVDDLPRFQEQLEQAATETARCWRSPRLTRPLWLTLATTPPVDRTFASPAEARRRAKAFKKSGFDCEFHKDNPARLRIFGCRACFAFHKIKCQYERCRYCNLSVKNFGIKHDEVSADQQLAALENALAQAKKRWPRDPLALEILPDGSFLNDFEVSERAQTAILARLKRVGSLQRIAIETRPEYCTVARVRRALRHLRPDQDLEIYFGLETTDRFISSAIHDKGYALEEFREKVSELLVRLSARDMSHLKISIYSIMKPPYLTDAEAIEACLHTARDMAELSQEIGLPSPINIKFEPSVISKGTLQHWLHSRKDGATGRRRFEPLSYYSVAELICRLKDAKLHETAKFGQRDDIDDFSTVSMIPALNNSMMFNPFDFLVYNAVQRFNSRRSFRAFLIDMRRPIEHPEESGFAFWETETYGRPNSSWLRAVVGDHLSTAVLSAQETARLGFQSKVWRVADRIEYNVKLATKLRERGDDARKQVRRSILDFLKKEGIRFLEIKPLSQYPLSSDATPSGYQTEIILSNEEGEPQSLWVRIPFDEQDFWPAPFAYGPLCPPPFVRRTSVAKPPRLPSPTSIDAGIACSGARN